MNKREVIKYGLEVFNNEKDKFRRWLDSPILFLNGGKPCELLESEEGLERIILLLISIEYGIFS
jgi:uncharacterized protein (DUF2384 family)